MPSERENVDIYAFWKTQFILHDSALTTLTNSSPNL